MTEQNFLDNIIISSKPVVEFENEYLKKGFAVVSKLVMCDKNLSDGAKLTYMWLCSYAWSEKGIFPSQNTLAFARGVLRQTIIENLKELVKYSYLEIIKEKREGKFVNNKYILKNDIDRKSKEQNILNLTMSGKPDTTPCRENPMSGKPDTNNNISIKNNIKDNNNVPDPENIKIAELLKVEIKINDPGANITDTQIREWADDVRLMVARDKRSLDEIRVLLIWACRHHFWKTNILSMGKFRKQFTRLTIQKKTEEKGHNSLQKREGSLNYVCKKQPIK